MRTPYKIETSPNTNVYDPKDKRPLEIKRALKLKTSLKWQRHKNEDEWVEKWAGGWKPHQYLFNCTPKNWRPLLANIFHCRHEKSWNPSTDRFLGVQNFHKIAWLGTTYRT